MKLFFLRTCLYLSLWIPAFVWVLGEAREAFKGHRFEFLILSNGRISSIQRENLFEQARSVQPGDRIIKIGGQDFEAHRVRQILDHYPTGSLIDVTVERRSELQSGELLIRGYSKRDILVLFLLPTLLSIIFLAFAILTPFQKFNYRKTQEAVEVFSILCLGLSFYFLFFLPSVSFLLEFSSSIGLPLLGAFFLHLFLVYPKKKGSRRLRWSFLTIVYLFSLALTGLRFVYWKNEIWWFPLLDSAALGACLICAMASLGNTLFTSRDFWTRRRARLLSLVFLLSFIGLVSVYISFLWHGPRISLERILAVSLLFPAAFAFIFSKENVFDLERIFRRGVHQILFTGIAIILAIIVGLSWTHWREQDTPDWLLWAAIAMVVALVARPAGIYFERSIHRLIQTRVRYPKVDEIFSESKSVEAFLAKLSQHLEKYLSLKEISYRFLKDPSAPLGEGNEQVWQWQQDHLVRRNFGLASSQYRTQLRSSEFLLGEIYFSGGDGIAFDPYNSRDWSKTCQSVARCLELMILREFLVSQQSLLAVGRMQALLAHEMKNPLAVIKVCSGLLKEHIRADAEGEELIRTIQAEVVRVSNAVQKVFDHSARHEKKVKVELLSVIDQARMSVLARFNAKTFDLGYWLNSKPVPWMDGKCWVWMEREAFFQAITNLLVNAFEAGSSHVKILVEVEEKKSLRIRVEDNGGGIPSDIELFKPFVSTKSYGTGLGLSQVKAFVDRHFGRIYLNSKLKHGTTFYLDFPASIFVKETERDDKLALSHP